MIQITVRDILTATGGTLLAGFEQTHVCAVSTDSRAVLAQTIFVPIVGEHFDGHSFISAALANGAAGCLCARMPEELMQDRFYIAVDDTRLALKALASWYRGQFRIPFVQITGSVGKTTTKEMVACVLSEHFETLKTAQNFNNDIGTPLTLLDLSEKHRAAVIETGMDHFGEIRYLGEMVRPDVALITNIGDAHIEFLGSRQGILQAKSEIFENLASDGVAILNGDDELLNTIRLSQRIIRCGEGENCDVRARKILDRGLDGMSCEVTTGDHFYHLRIPSPGRHMICAAAMAVAVGEVLHLTEREIERGISSYQPAGSRMRIHRLSGDRRVLDDCYNANPQSMASSLRVLAGSEGKKIAVLGDMAELGALTEESHRNIGKLTEELDITEVFAIGDKAKHFTECNRKIRYFASISEAIPALHEAFAHGSTMLVKASHSMHFEKIIEDFIKEA